MMRRCFLHVLLSLLLLVGQQMAFAHAMSHWTGKLGGGAPTAASALIPTAAGSELSSAVAQDQSCNQCLAFAQMGNAIGGEGRHYFAADRRGDAVPAGAASAANARTVCVFDTRAPPAFV